MMLATLLEDRPNSPTQASSLCVVVDKILLLMDSLGASGTRIMNHLVYELHRRQAKYALGSTCIGGGKGDYYDY